MENVIIIGSGPAGYTAAIYAARANLSPLLFEGQEPGGQLTTTSDVENYPGYPEGVLGPKMMEDFKKQAERFGTRVVAKTVTAVDFGVRPTGVDSEGAQGSSSGPLQESTLRGKPADAPDAASPHRQTARSFVVFCGEEKYEARAIIISTGASAKRLGLENEKKLYGKGVSACATCDGFFFKGKTVVVVGGGDTAMEEANFLTRFASKVYLVHRRDEFRASKIMLERAQKNPKIEFMMNTVVEDVLGVEVDHVTGVTLRKTDAQRRPEEQGDEGSRANKNEILRSAQDDTWIMPCDGVFAAIGHEPNTKIFAGQIELDQKGYIVTKQGSTMTSIEGVFAGGDCVDHKYRQAVTAAGLGCSAAIDAERWLEGQE